MELNAVWAALLRRWYITLVGVAIAIAVTALMVVKMGPTYKAEGAVLLFPPITTIKNGTTVETQGNPYLMLGGLSQARDIVIRAMNSRSAKDQFAEVVPSASYEVTPDFSTSGPIIVIDVSAPSSAAAVGGLDSAIATVPGTLKSLQSGLDLPQAAYITSRQLTADTVPEVVRSGQIRGGIVVGVGGIVVVLFLVGLIDGLLRGRQRPGSRHGRSRRKAGPDVVVEEEERKVVEEERHAQTLAPVNRTDPEPPTRRRSTAHVSTGSR